MLSAGLLDNGCKSMHAESDADLLIVQTAIEAASQRATSLIGEDTDPLVLLCFHVDANLHPLFLIRRKTSLQENRMWHVHYLSAQLALKQGCQLLAFVPGFSGCDTTLQLYGIGN